MARSTYIYVLTEDELLLAAFTVKHEMMTWLDNHPGEYEAWRILDGGGGVPSTMDIDHQDTETASAGCRNCGWTASGPRSRQAAIEHSDAFETHHSTRMMSR